MAPSIFRCKEQQEEKIGHGTPKEKYLKQTEPQRHNGPVKEVLITMKKKIIPSLGLTPFPHACYRVARLTNEWNDQNIFDSLLIILTSLLV